MYEKIVISKEDIRKLNRGEMVIIRRPDRKIALVSTKRHNEWLKEMAYKKPIFKDNLPENWQ